MNSKTLRSLSLSMISLAGQFGVRITVEQLEKKISQGQIKSEKELKNTLKDQGCLLYTSPSPRDATLSRMPSSA